MYKVYLEESANIIREEFFMSLRKCLDWIYSEMKRRKIINPEEAFKKLKKDRYVNCNGIGFGYETIKVKK